MSRLLPYFLWVLLVLASAPAWADSQSDDFCGGAALRCARTGAVVCTCTLETAPQAGHGEPLLAPSLEIALVTPGQEPGDPLEPTQPCQALPERVPTPPPRP